MDEKRNADGRKKVDTTSAVLMIVVAIFFDAMQFIIEFFTGLIVEIPLINALTFLGILIGVCITVYAWLTFYVWFKVKGWGVSGANKKNVAAGKKLVVKWLTPLLETIPYVNVLPMWTISVFVQLSILKAEDLADDLKRGKVPNIGVMKEPDLPGDLSQRAVEEKFNRVLNLKTRMDSRNTLSLKPGRPAKYPEKKNGNKINTSQEWLDQ